MPRRKDDPRYESWYVNYRGETLRQEDERLPKMRKEQELRRRIEDIHEGLRLDRDVFGEVWDE